MNVLLAVVTCGCTTPPPLGNNLYTSPPQGVYCLCSLSKRNRPCRRSAGDHREILLPAEVSVPLSPLRALFFVLLLLFVLRTRISSFRETCARISFWNSCRAPRVGAIGCSAALIITARGTRSLSWDNAASLPDGLLSAPLFSFFGGRERITRRRIDRDARPGTYAGDYRGFRAASIVDIVASRESLDCTCMMCVCMCTKCSYR